MTMGEKGLLHSHMKTFFAIHLVNHTVAWRYGHAPLRKLSSSAEMRFYLMFITRQAKQSLD
jgi:hypothetical protein